jgi:hypothetical protein
MQQKGGEEAAEKGGEIARVFLCSYYEKKSNSIPTMRDHVGIADLLRARQWGEDVTPPMIEPLWRTSMPCRSAASSILGPTASAR